MPPKLAKNFEMAVNRLESAEEKLLKHTQMAGVSSDVLHNYIQKGNLSKVTST